MNNKPAQYIIQKFKLRKLRITRIMCKEVRGCFREHVRAGLLEVTCELRSVARKGTRNEKSFVEAHSGQTEGTELASSPMFKGRLKKHT